MILRYAEPLICLCSTKIRLWNKIVHTFPRRFRGQNYQMKYYSTTSWATKSSETLLSSYYVGFNFHKKTAWLRLQKVIQLIGNLTQYTYTSAKTGTTVCIKFPFVSKNSVQLSGWGMIILSVQILSPLEITGQKAWLLLRL
jgi:hypothetical protein